MTQEYLEKQPLEMSQNFFLGTMPKYGKPLNGIGFMRLNMTEFSIVTEQVEADNIVLPTKLNKKADHVFSDTFIIPRESIGCSRADRGSLECL